ncbi:MAG: aminoacyl-tRNA hydrolase [Hyphomicrobiales bacterium]|nr:aminoacyl-tRNA hydrolase [Hyphomicrobiales bacterium]
MKLFVGLGNPGDKYLMNRHNVGFMAVDAIASEHEFGPWKKRFQGAACELQTGAYKVVILKPGTYMNESGRAVGEAMRFFKVAPADVTVFHDDLDLEPGKLKVKTGGGHAGHNGLRSIAAHIGPDFRRVRIGIGHPGDKSKVSNYVLGDFAKADHDWLAATLDGIAKAASKLVEGQDAPFLNEAARIARPVKGAAAKVVDLTFKAANGSAEAFMGKVSPVSNDAPALSKTGPAEPAATTPKSGALGGFKSWIHHRFRAGVSA